MLLLLYVTRRTAPCSAPLACARALEMESDHTTGLDLPLRSRLSEALMALSTDSGFPLPGFSRSALLLALQAVCSIGRVSVSITKRKGVEKNIKVLSPPGPPLAALFRVTCFFEGFWKYSSLRPALDTRRLGQAVFCAQDLQVPAPARALRTFFCV